MGVDKALLPHPDGGTWMSRSLELLARLNGPVSLVSPHVHHRDLARNLSLRLQRPLEILEEQPVFEGPLLALQLAMERHPDERLLLLAVDQPWLQLIDLHRLVGAAAADPARIHIANDGERFQPFPGIYPADARHRSSLVQNLSCGQRSLLAWARSHQPATVALPPENVRNANHPEDARRLWAEARPQARRNLLKVPPWPVGSSSSTGTIAPWGCCDSP